MLTQKSKLLQSKKVLIAVAVAVILVAAAGAYAYKHSRDTSAAAKKGANTTSAIDYSPATKADNNPNNDRKSSSNPTTTLDNNGSGSATSGKFSVQLTGANLQSGNVHIGTLVDGTTSGSCVLTAAQSGQATLQLGTSTVRQNVTTYDCGVFNIPTSSFTSSGKWQLSLTVKNGTEENTGTYDVTIP